MRKSNEWPRRDQLDVLFAVMSIAWKRVHEISGHN